MRLFFFFFLFLFVTLASAQCSTLFNLKVDFCHNKDGSYLIPSCANALTCNQLCQTLSKYCAQGINTVIPDICNGTLKTVTATFTFTSTLSSTSTATDTNTATKTSTFTVTPTPTPTCSINAFSGDFSGNVTNINLKTCNFYINGHFTAGYEIVENQNNEMYCCAQRGVLYGSICTRGVCGSELDSYVFATTDTTNCLVDCVPYYPQNITYLCVSSLTNGTVYNGGVAEITSLPTYTNYIILNGAYFPIYSTSNGWGCLIEGTYNGTTCSYYSGCAGSTSTNTNFFYYNTSCYLQCWYLIH